jgi:hypothetical protein
LIGPVRKLPSSSSDDNHNCVSSFTTHNPINNQHIESTSCNPVIPTADIPSNDIRSNPDDNVHTKLNTNSSSGLSNPQWIDDLNTSIFGNKCDDPDDIKRMDEFETMTTIQENVLTVNYPALENICSDVLDKNNDPDMMSPDPPSDSTTPIKNITSSRKICNVLYNHLKQNTVSANGIDINVDLRSMSSTDIDFIRECSLLSQTNSDTSSNISERDSKEGSDTSLGKSSETNEIQSTPKVTPKKYSHIFFTVLYATAIFDSTSFIIGRSKT